MGEVTKQPRKIRDQPGEITIKLNGMGMTALHKVGLAGLWMTLAALDKDHAAKKRICETRGSWETTNDSVTLFWQEPKKFFKVLFHESFKLDDRGLLWFPALGSPMRSYSHAIILQEAILGTFLQHGKTRKADEADKPKGNLSIEIDNITYTYSFCKIYQYPHQNADRFSATSVNKLVGWQYPGAVERHVTSDPKKATAFEEPPDRALALWFAPIGSIYFRINRVISSQNGVKPRFVLVIPNVDDLARYERARQIFAPYGPRDFTVAGIADAGFRVLAEIEGVGLLNDIASASCRIVSFDTFPWSKAQKTRSEIFEIKPTSDRSLRTYRLCRQLFRATPVIPKNGNPYWEVPHMPELVARNLTISKPWWHGFSDFIADQERRDHIFSDERGGIAKMIADPHSFEEASEKFFVEACHQALERRFGQLSSEAVQQNRSFEDMCDRECVKLRVKFARCKNATSLREAVTDFWSRAGGFLPALREHWTQILHLMDDKHWRKSKDLALLALASYKSTKK